MSERSLEQDAVSAHRSSAATPLLVAGHLPGLDGLRAIAALMVVVFHAARVSAPPGPGAPWYASVASAGWIGVDLFFVLSGFLITGILLDSKGKRGYFGVFYARRSLRIFPLYYATLLGLLLLPAHTDAAQRWATSWRGGLWNYGLNVRIALEQSWHVVPDYFNHFWSLAVEEQFYLLWPLLVYLTPAKRTAALCAAVVVLATSVRYWLAWHGHPDAALVLMPCRADALAAGALLAIAAREWPDRLRRLARFSGYAVIVSALLVVGYALARGEWAAADPVVCSFGMSGLAVAFAALLLWVLSRAPHARSAAFLDGAALSAIGRYSYGIYVLHFPILCVFTSHQGMAHLRRWIPSELGAQAAFVLGLVVASVGAAAVSWNVMERPLLRMKARWQYGAGAAPDGAGAERLDVARGA